LVAGQIPSSLHLPAFIHVILYVERKKKGPSDYITSTPIASYTIWGLISYDWWISYLTSEKRKTADAAISILIGAHTRSFCIRHLTCVDVGVFLHV
jgi:hypothetical protein